MILSALGGAGISLSPTYHPDPVLEGVASERKRLEQQRNLRILWIYALLECVSVRRSDIISCVSSVLTSGSGVPIAGSFNG